MEDLINFANLIIEQMNTAKDSFDSFFDRAVLWFIVTYFQIKLEALKYSSGLATALIASIGLSELINQAWGSIDASIVTVLNYCRVPDALNLILTAFVTRFILNLIPF